MTMTQAIAFPLKRVLAVSDFSPAATNAVWRAALLARDHGAWLRVLHVAASKSGAQAAQRALDALGWELQERLKIGVLAHPVRGDFRRELLAATRDVDVVVVRTSQSQPIRDWIAGVHPGRWLSACGIPALVVKRPAAVSYRRILVSAHDGATATASIAVATGMARGPYREVLRALDADEELAAAWSKTGVQSRGDRHHAARRLRHLVQDLMGQEYAPRIGDAPTIVFDGAASALLAKERSIFADLMVFAGHAVRKPALSVGRSNTREILAGAAADVLVLPGIASPEAEPGVASLTTA